MSSNTKPTSTSTVTATEKSINPMIETALKADSVIAAKAMHGGNTQDGFVKNLFQSVQGVKYDARCPHGLPYYACMSCTH